MSLGNKTAILQVRGKSVSGCSYKTAILQARGQSVSGYFHKTAIFLVREKSVSEFKKHTLHNEKYFFQPWNLEFKKRLFKVKITSINY